MKEIFLIHDTKTWSYLDFSVARQNDLVFPTSEILIVKKSSDLKIWFKASKEYYPIIKNKDLLNISK